MNVLYLINYAGRGGTERYIKNLVSHIKEITPFLCYNEEELLVEELKGMGVQTCRLSMTKPFDLKAAWQLKKICREYQINVIHTHYLRENYIAILSKWLGNRVKIVYTAHFAQQDKGKIKACNQIFYRFLDKIIAISSAVKKTVSLSGAPDKKIIMIHHGVELKDQTLERDEVFREKYKIEKDTFLISCCSRFAEGKGNAFLIRSIRKLVERGEKGFKVLLANDGETLEECKQLVKELGLMDIIEFIGYLKEVEHLYRASDLCVTPSEHEGLGLAILEALSYGIPNVATDIPAITEIINEWTDCGITVGYDDEDAMADAICKMIQDKELREHYRKNAFKTVEEGFSMQAMCQKTFKIYEEVLG